MTEAKEPTKNLEIYIQLELPKLVVPGDIGKILDADFGLISKLYDLIPSSERHKVEVTVGAIVTNFNASMQSIRRDYLNNGKIEISYKGKIS